MNRLALPKLPGWLAAVLWMSVIFILSALPGTTVDEVSGGVFGFNHLDKIAHASVYAVLGWLWMRALRQSDRPTLPKALALAIIITVAYGATDEWHQYFVPGRYCGLGDWFADAIGGTLGAVGYYWHDTQRRRQTS